MLAEQGASDRKVAIDAGAAIKLQRLDRFGGELFTTGGVIREIRDEHARMLLQTLPQEIRVREPLAADILFTRQFAKATGDLGFLSQNDIELIALTVGLHREQGGSVKDRPALLKTEEGSSRFDWAPDNSRTYAKTPAETSSKRDCPQHDAAVAHFAEASSETAVADVLAEVMESSETVVANVLAQAEAPPDEIATAAKSLEPAADGKVESSDGSPHQTKETSDAVAEDAKGTNAEAQIKDALPGGGAALSGNARPVEPAVDESAQPVEEDEAEPEVSDEDGSSAGEWVTQENLHRFGCGIKPAAELKATCATADYSVQNVLLQMGITPLTFDGFAVRSVKLWGLVCRACFHFSRDTQKVFCEKCGNATVQRVPIIVDQDGQAKMLNSGRRMKLKGSVYSMPKPEGGRGWKPIYAEDEILMGGRDREMRRLQKLQDKDRQARDPFDQDNSIRAWYQRSNTSGRGSHQIPRMKAGLGRTNPNAGNFKGYKSKKR
jgi:RNA-binding protein NOB1